MKDFEKLYNIFSVSSAEKESNSYIKNLYKAYDYQVEEDNLYSIFLSKKTSNTEEIKLMLASPLDEYGLMINNVEDKEKIKFIFLEDISPLAYVNQKVSILTRKGHILSGVVCLDKRYLEDKKVDFDEADLYIKIIDGDKEEVNIGDLVSLDSDLIINDDYIIGRSLGQKLFQFLTILLADKIKDKTFNYSIFMGSIAQSTIGFRGTQTSTYMLEPNFAIALTGFEINESSPKINFGDGPILSYYDSKLLPDQEFLRFIKENFNLKAYMGLRANDGSFIHKTLKGAKTVALGLPIKNMGTSYEIVSKKDFVNLYEFMLEFLDKMNDYRIDHEY